MSEHAKIDNLLHNEAYVAFLDDIKAQRESWITQLHKANQDDVFRISGRILMADEILESGGYLQIEERRKQKA